MILFDVNVLLNAHRGEQPDHELARDLLQRTVADVRPYALSELILGSFVRIATHRRALNPPTPLGDALDFCEGLRSRPNARIIAAGPRHWAISEPSGSGLVSNQGLIGDRARARQPPKDLPTGT